MLFFVIVLSEIDFGNVDTWKCRFVFNNLEVCDNY